MSIEKEINLASIVEVMWNRAKGIIIFTFATMVLAMLATLTLQNRYTATAKLLMNKSKLGEHTMQNPAIQMNTYLEIAMDDALLQSLIETYKFDEPPYSFEYRKDLKSRIEVEILDDTSLIEIVVQLEDAQTAADVANAVAQDLIDKSTGIMQYESTTSSDRIAQEVTRMSIEVERKRQTYETILTKNKLQLVRNELDTRISMLAKERQEIANIESTIVQLESKATVMEEVMSSTDFTKLVITKNNILRDRVIEKTVESELEDINLEQLSTIVFENENVNTAYLDMKREFETLRADLAGQRAMLEDKKVRVIALEKHTDELQQRLSEMDLQEMVAKADFDRSLEILSGIDKQEGWAGTSVVTERQDLFRVIDAIAPDTKSYPQRSLMVGIVGSIAFLLSFMYYLLRDLYGLVKEEKLKKRDPEILS